MSGTPPCPARLLVIPHVGIAGGAGLYNRAAIDVLARHAEVTVAGPAASAYAGRDRTTGDLVLPVMPVIPAYAGASLRAFCVHAIRAPYRLWRVRQWIARHRDSLRRYDAVVTTSSIDSLALLAFAQARLRTICIVQENVFLSGLRGRINRAFLRRVDIVVSISEGWSRRAREHGIESVVAANPFTLPATPASPDDGGPTDVLFMGGGERIKGLTLFLSLIRELAAQRPVRAVILGALSPASATQVEAVREQVSGTDTIIEAPGFVDDPAPFLRAARLLLLPITDPHFCRPAVEAGLAGRTFIVSRLPDLADFAQEGMNCAMARAGDVGDWTAVTIRLLDSDGDRCRLAAANRDLALDRFSPAAFDTAWRRIGDEARWAARPCRP